MLLEDNNKVATIISTELSGSGHNLIIGIGINLETQEINLICPVDISTVQVIGILREIVNGGGSDYITPNRVLN